MLGTSKKIIVVIIASLFLLTALPFIENAGINVNPSGSKVDALYYVPIYINNVQQKSTPTPFDEMIVVNSNNYSSYENLNLSNVFFTYMNGSIVPSWLESGNFSTDTNSTYWLRINDSIAPGNVLEIKMNFLPVGEIAFNNYSTGEAPYFSSSYGLYDDGSHVFNMYDNFSGTTLKGSIWNLTASATSYISVDNGITFGGSGTYLVSNEKFNNSGYADAYGVMNTPIDENQISYFLGGIGFGNGNMNDVSPVMTTGWAENDTNGLGLSIWMGNGNAYTYNFSKSLNPNHYYVFGTGYINSTYTTGAINNTVQNYSKLGTTDKLNVVLGFQTGNYPQVNHFYWVYERNTTSTGQNLPFSISTPTYTVTINSSGLGTNADWSINVINVTSVKVASTASFTMNLFNGIYNYSVTSLNKSYEPVSSTGTFTINGSPYHLVVDFKPVLYSQIVTEVGLPSGTTWYVNITNGGSFNSSTSTISFNEPNGSYEAVFSSSDSVYFPTPESLSFEVSGSGISFPVGFALDANKTYLNPVSTIDLLNQKTYSGAYFNGTDQLSSVSYSLAIDSVNDLMFITLFGAQRALMVYNLSTDSFIKSIPMSGQPIWDTYDSYTGYVYVTSISGNLTIINPHTLSIVKNVTIPGGRDNYTTITAYGPNVYALSSNGNLSVFNATTGAIIKTIKVADIEEVSPFFYVKSGEILLANDTGNLEIINTTTYSINDLSLPTDYYPFSVVNYSKDSVLIGGKYSDQIYNLSSKQLENGPMIKEKVVASSVDPLSGIVYLFGYNESLGHIYSVQASTDVVKSVIPGAGPQFTVAFDEKNQNVYADDFYLGSVSVYSAQHYYPVTFTETGLPSGSTWYVNLTNGMDSGAITGSTYSFTLSNGTYSYTVATSDHIYKPTSYTGSITVDGASLSESVKFVEVTYTVTFTESGLPSGTTWYVSLTNGNTSGPITGTSYSFIMSNGTYSYTISSVSGYSVSKGVGNFTVNGGSITVNTTFSKVTSGLNVIDYSVIAVIAVILVSAFIIFMRRRK
jgi:hypothetical protein